MLPGDDPYHDVPEPTLFLMGCQAWPPRHLHPERDCQVCDHGPNPGDDHMMCGWCDACTDRRERSVKAARLGVHAEEAAEAAERAALDQLDQLVRKLTRQGLFTESARRRLWMGSKSSPLYDHDGLVNRARVGRVYLRSIGRLPDFSLAIDMHGNAKGRRATTEDREVVALAGGAG